MKEDPRKTALKNGLRQLTLEQLQRVVWYQGEMLLDKYNCYDGKFCPLAIALGIDKIMKKPNNKKVVQVLTLLGYKVYNTKGVKGKFYTDFRERDLAIALTEVVAEKKY